MMRIRRVTVWRFLAAALLLTAWAHMSMSESTRLRFGRDTVLVWNVVNEAETASFVVRIAEFQPNRFIEWENASTQGTIYMSNNAVMNAKVFVTARLFEAGVDTKGKDATTLWLSQKIFRELKAKGKAKLAIDSLDGWMVAEGNEELVVEVNRSPTPLPVVKVRDDRGMERWFLDLEENPLMAKHTFRAFSQTLKSITTDRPNTLRWIKGKKLTSPR